MIDNAVLRAGLQVDLDRLGLSGAQADQVVHDANVLACILIDAVLRGVPHGKAN